ncbi:MAG: ABC transporter permease [Mangrovibacterium sp.]
MSLALSIARRYLVSRKSVNVINLISVISVLGVTVGTLALIVVLSAFNGIDSFIGTMLSSFDPDLKITSSRGKSFSPDDPLLKKTLELEGIAGWTPVVEENALLEYEGSQKYAVVKGVEADYADFTGLDTVLTDGRFLLESGLHHFAVIGQGVAFDLSLRPNFIKPLHVYFPKRDRSNLFSLTGALNHDSLFPAGVFSVQQEIDSRYILVPIGFARSVFDLDERVTALELKPDSGVDVVILKEQVRLLLGDGYRVQDRYEQHEFLYKVMRSEKWSSFLILSFILVIASFNLLGSLTMIILDKKDDVFILQSMGASASLIRKIFLLEGWLISLTGALSGSLLGVVLVWAQQKFELLKLPGNGSFAISSYPVELQFYDVAVTLLVVLGIGLLAAWYPVHSMESGRNENSLLIGKSLTTTD